MSSKKFEPVKQSSAERLLVKSAEGVTFLLFGQAFTKLSTFIMNQILITYVSPKIFGINAFLEFLMSSILFFSREGIRLSSQRIQDPDDEDLESSDSRLTEKLVDKYDNRKLIHGSRLAILQSIINIGYVPLCIGFPLATVIMYWQYGKISDLFKNMELFNVSLILIYFAVIFELLSEPFYILNQFNLNYDKRTRYETSAITLSCFINFAVIFWFKDQTNHEGLPILAFSIGKLAHSLTLLMLYYLDFRRFRKQLHNGNHLSLALTKIYKQSNQDFHYFDSGAISHFYKMFFNLCFKHLLTEGDKLIINSLCTVEEQGIYSLISNYGSLLARLVFAPIEESLRNFLTRLLSDNKTTKGVKLSIDILKKITHFYLYLSLIIAIFGPLNSGYLIQKIVGNNWSNHVSDTIPLYTLYLPLLAFNGILEAVHQSTANGNEVVKYTYFMIVFSFIFFITSYIGIEYFKLSLHGLILSNMINMFLRIIYCYAFIKDFFVKSTPNFKIFEFDSNTKSITSLSLVILALDYFLFGVVRNLKELIGNIFLALILVTFIMYKEKDLILSIIRKKPLA
jgi:oligosaccharide translocation protein RFT1